VFSRRIPEHVCEICIEGEGDAPLFYSRNPYVVVVGAREAYLYYRQGVVAQIADCLRMQRR